MTVLAKRLGWGLHATWLLVRLLVEAGWLSLEHLRLVPGSKARGPAERPAVRACRASSPAAQALTSLDVCRLVGLQHGSSCPPWRSDCRPIPGPRAGTLPHQDKCGWSTRLRTWCMADPPVVAAVLPTACLRLLARRRCPGDARTLHRRSLVVQPSIDVGQPS